MSSTNVTTTDNQKFFQPDSIPESFKKAVGVVQVAMGELGLLHRKCYNVALANAYEGLGRGERTFRVPISVVSDWCDFNSNNYQALYDVFEDLRATPVKSIKFDSKEAKKGRRRKRVGGDGLLSSFALIEGGIVEYSFSEAMAEILHEPEQYIWLSLNAQNKFHSKYELNLFENCIRYIHVGSTGFKSVEDWRSLLGATEDYYDDFKNLNRKVIKKATDGVNSKSGILVRPEVERERRKVKRIKFDVQENPQMQLFEYQRQNAIRETEAYQKLVGMGLTDFQAIYAVEKKGETVALEIAAYVAARKPDNPAGYLVDALKEGWGEKSPAERQKEADLEQARKEAVAAKERAARREALESAFETHQTKRTLEIIQALTGEDKAHVTELVEAGDMVSTLAKPWRNQIDRDLSRVGELPSKLAVWVASRCKVPVLEKWGEPRDRDFEIFATSVTQ